MKIKLYLLTYYLLLLLIAGITIDTLETWYGINTGLEEANIITLFIMQFFENNVLGILASGVFKIMMLLILYTLSIMIETTVANLGIFSKRFINIGLELCIILFLIIANYTTYYAVWNNIILIVG